MKTKSFIIIGIIIAIAVSIIYVSFAYNQEIKLATGMMTSDEKPQPSMLSDPICFVVDRSSSGQTGSAVTMDRCFTLSEFEKIGCTKPMLEHLDKHSNLLDFESNGTWYLEFVGLPDGISQENFDKCVDAILEKRPILTSINQDKSTTYNYDISGVKQFYNIGEPISFTETVQGYGNPCISPHYEIIDENTLETVWQYKIVYPCPFITDPQQFKTTTTVPNDNIPAPILNQTGQYVLRSHHSYSDGYEVVTFSVIDESVGELENEN